MKIKNAKIKNVTTKIVDGRLFTSMEFHEAVGFVIFRFRLANPVEMTNLTKLMEFAEVREANELEDKIIRVAEHEDAVGAIGHPIEDRFIDVTNTMINIVEEVTEAELLKKYPETK